MAKQQVVKPSGAAKSKLTDAEKNMPDAVWNKIASEAPREAFKSWQARDVWFRDKYQAYLQKQQMAGAARAAQNSQADVYVPIVKAGNPGMGRNMPVDVSVPLKGKGNPRRKTK